MFFRLCGHGNMRLHSNSMRALVADFLHIVQHWCQSFHLRPLAIVVAIASAWGCSGVTRDTNFSRDFLVRLRAGDPSVAGVIDSTLLSEAGSWQSLRATVESRLPSDSLDSIVFVSKTTNSKMPRSVRLVTLNVFAGRTFSTVEMYLETGKNGKTMLNTIRTTGPVALP